MKNYTEVVKDITTVEKGVVAHSCNAKGVMGSGVALALRMTWPAIFPPYVDFCKQSKLGEVLMVNVGPNLYVANMICQPDYRGSSTFKGSGPPASVKLIKLALANLLEQCLLITNHIYLPKIGAGLGGLNWDNDVEPLVDQFASEARKVGIDVTICNWG